MKIAVISRNDINDIRSWSGTDYYTFQALKIAGQKKGIDFCVIDKLYSKRNKIVIFLEKIISKLLWKTVNRVLPKDFYDYNIKFLAKQIQKELPNDVDVIFSMTSWPLTYLKSDKIKAFYSDGEIGEYIDLYPVFKNLSTQLRKKAIRLREYALNNSDLVFFASEWAVNATRKRYVNKYIDKIRNVPFGANIECTRTNEDIIRIIENKNGNEINLLFVGANWEWKGGSIALETAKVLHEKGVKVHLDIVGINNCPVKLPEYIKSHGFISKATDEGKRKIDELYEKAHFFILPTRFDCYGIVFCEASSFGIPSLATRIAGVSSVVLDGKNGKLFELADGGEKYAEYIQEMLVDYENYKKMCYSSFEQYETRLNWKVAGEKIIEYIEEIYAQ